MSSWFSTKPSPAKELDILQRPLSDFPGHWLEIHCCKGVSRMQVCKMLELYRDRLLRVVLEDLRCRVCHGRPPKVYLCERQPRDFTYGAAPGKSWKLKG